jgi:hypothetical protein
VVSTCDFESQDPGSNPGISSTRVVQRQGYLVFTQKAGVRLPAWVFFLLFVCRPSSAASVTTKPATPASKHVRINQFFLLLCMRIGPPRFCPLIAPVGNTIECTHKLYKKTRCCFFRIHFALIVADGGARGSGRILWLRGEGVGNL